MFSLGKWGCQWGFSFKGEKELWGCQWSFQLREETKSEAIGGVYLREKKKHRAVSRVF